MTQLTEEQKRLYLQYKGVLCPVCGSMNIDNVGDVQIDAGIAWQNVECNKCHAEFVDLYDLVSVRGSEDLA